LPVFFAIFVSSVVHPPQRDSRDRQAQQALDSPLQEDQRLIHVPSSACNFTHPTRRRSCALHARLERHPSALNWWWDATSRAHSTTRSRWSNA